MISLLYNALILPVPHDISPSKLRREALDTLRIADPRNPAEIITTQHMSYDRFPHSYPMSMTTHSPLTGAHDLILLSIQTPLGLNPRLQHLHELRAFSIAIGMLSGQGLSINCGIPAAR